MSTKSRNYGDTTTLVRHNWVTKPHAISVVFMVDCFKGSGCIF